MTLTKTQRVLTSVAVVGAAAGLAGLGTFAAFTDTETGTQEITGGTVSVALDGDGTNTLSVTADGVVPGDTIQRRVVLRNTGNQNLASLTLTTRATTSSLLDTDTTNGLHATVQKCGGALGWTEAGGPNGPFTYTCDQTSAGDNQGTRTTVLSRRPVIFGPQALSLNALTAAGVDDMVVTVDLPNDAPNSMQGARSVMEYRFDATQRAGTDR